MRLYWLDLETTGLDPRRNSILEVAVFAATLDRPFDANPIYHATVARNSFAEFDPEAREMHARSGLLDETLDGAATPLATVEADLLRLIPAAEEGEEAPVLAGASVHFDLGFLREILPRVAARFSHRVYDVSAIKLFCRSLGMPKLARGGAHRAVADVAEAVAHAVACAAWLGRSPVLGGESFLWRVYSGGGAELGQAEAPDEATAVSIVLRRMGYQARAAGRNAVEGAGVDAGASWTARKVATVVRNGDRNLASLCALCDEPSEPGSMYCRKHP